MLILNIGDQHLTGKNPICRVDDLVEVQFIKLEEIISLANKFDCPIVSPGDITNVPILANSLLTRLGELVTKLKHPLYCVYGNHDLMYHNLSMANRTSLGMLLKNNDKIRHISEFENDYGITWDYCDWNQPLIKTGGKYLLIHQAIVDLKMIGGKSSWILHDKEFSRVVDDELNQYEIILCGHWHKRYRFKNKNTVVFNPGPVVRRTVEDTEEPTVQLINLENKLRRIIKLKSVKPTELVITDKHLEANIHKVMTNIHDFINALKNKKRKLSSSFLDNLVELLDSHELDKSIELILRNLVANLIERKGA